MGVEKVFEPTLLCVSRRSDASRVGGVGRRRRLLVVCDDAYKVGPARKKGRLSHHRPERPALGRRVFSNGRGTAAPSNAKDSRGRNSLLKKDYK
jgi:hypothetical protein